MVDIRLEADIGREVVSVPRVRGKILSALQKFAKELEKVAESTTETFESYTVTWQSDVRYAGGNVVVQLSTDSTLYKFLDEGTSHRWAVMNDPFSPKTVPGRISAGRGERTYNDYGEYTAIRGRRAMQERNMQARPGIDARDFSQIIANNMVGDLYDAVERAIDEGLS